MASVNKVILVGHLGRDPEVRYAPSGTAVVNVSLATSRRWKDKTSGETQEETEWHRIVAYDRLAEIIGEHLAKGSLAYFEGRLKTRKWTDKDGVEKYTTEIVADQLQMLGSKGDGGGKPAAARHPAAGTGNAYADSKSGKTPAPAAAKPSTGFDDMDDDIPF